MLTSWIDAGQPQPLFWQLTIREIETVLTGAADRAFRERQNIYFGAYFSGVFSQPYDKNKYPAYDKYAPRRKRLARGVRRNWHQLKMLVQTWNASVGGFDNRGKS